MKNFAKTLKNILYRKRKEKLNDLPTLDTPIDINLDGIVISNENGNWVLSHSNEVKKEPKEVELQKRLIELQNENRLLKYRQEILIDMVSFTKT